MNSLIFRFSLNGFKTTSCKLTIVKLIKNVQFCSISRLPEISTTDIHLVFRGLKFVYNAEIGQKGAFFISFS